MTNWRKNLAIIIQLIGAMFIFGVFANGSLGLIGLVLVLYGGNMYRLENKIIECPSCKERIRKDGMKCRFCGYILNNQSKSVNK